MNLEATIEPWEELARLLETDDAPAVESFLRTLAPSELPRVLDRLNATDRARVLQLVSPEVGAAMVDHFHEAQAVEIIEQLPVPDAAAILNELASDEQADLLTEMAPQEAQAILAAMEPEEAKNALELSHYPHDTAGGLMIKEFLAFPEDSTVREVIEDLRQNREKYQHYNVLYAYTIDRLRRLTGVLRIRNLLLSSADGELKAMAHPSVSIPADASLEELDALFDSYPFLAFPVIGPNGELVGVVERSAVEEAVSERSDDAYRASQGIVLGEEIRSMPVRVRAGRRLSWLSVNILLNIVAASVIAFYEDTLSAVIALAVFLPIVSDMSGCSGNQAVAVSVREMALGIVRPTDAFRVWRQEILVGLANGIVLGGLIALVAWAWRGNAYLGLVVGTALALNTLVAVSLGGLLPLILKRFGRDPALASGPILTTVTDMCGFFFMLGLATLLLSKLVGA